MGVAELHTELEELYDDSYYEGSDGAIGYTDYAYTAEHALAWAASLVRLLLPAGRVLDIGCADGHLLLQLMPTYTCYGIEVNPRMAARAEQAGVTVIGSDIFGPGIVEDYRGHFDAVTAIAVFEHTRDFRRAVEIALELLSPGGFLLFEVPLIGPGSDEDVWFTSSLEHVFYPSDAALRHLFTMELGQPLVGGEERVTGYGSIFVGLTTRPDGRGCGLMERYRALTSGPISELQSREQRWFRVLFDLVHTARASPELLRLLREFEPSDLTPLLFRRLVDLWSADAGAAAYLHAVEEARDYHQARATELNETLQAIYRTKAWRGILKAQRVRSRLSRQLSKLQLGKLYRQ